MAVPGMVVAGTVVAGDGTEANGIAAGVAAFSLGCRPSTHRLRCITRPITIRPHTTRRHLILTVI